MKKVILGILTVTAIALGCKKDKDTLNPSLTGSWGLLGYSGGIAGGKYTPIVPENITFTDDKSYTRTKDGKVISQGTYDIRLITPNYSPNVKDTVIYYSNDLLPTTFHLKGRDTLFLSDYQISDGFTFGYVRRK